jgi:hypothetical protein
MAVLGFAVLLTGVFEATAVEEEVVASFASLPTCEVAASLVAPSGFKLGVVF